MTPLSHHDIVRLAAPYTGLGLRVDLAASVRAERRVRLAVQEIATADGESGSVHHELIADERGEITVRRAVWHPAGMASVVHASGREGARLALALDAIPLSDQLCVSDGAICTRSFRLWLEATGNGVDTACRIELTHLAACAGHLVLSVDVTTGGGMPADVTLAATGSAVNGPQTVRSTRNRSGRATTGRAGLSGRPRSTLASGGWLPAFDPLLRGCQVNVEASGELPALPDDLLAVLGAQWRPLRPYGDHFRTVLRGLGAAPRRADRANAGFEEAVSHLQRVLTAPAADYHPRFQRQRLAVFLRRLRPVFLLTGILAVMPVMYLAVTSGGMTLHPLMLGLAPLLMVAAVAMSVREIPVMEWPAWPAPLRADAFADAAGKPAARQRASQEV